MTTPAVTVLMPVYNGAPYLREAVDSILNQTFSDFDFLIVDDGSTDETPKILEEYIRKDARVRVVRNEKNLRISASLNRGLELAAAPLIARMDADDVSLPERLEKQVEFMRKHPDVAVCGGALQLYERPDVWVPPLEHEAIRACLLFESAIFHPTAIFKKREILSVGGYDPALPPAEDYALWVAAAMYNGCRVANLETVVLRYRIHPNQRDGYQQAMRDKADTVRRMALKSIGLRPDAAEGQSHLLLASGGERIPLADLRACRAWLNTLAAAATTLPPPFREALIRELKRRWKLLFTERQNFSLSLAWLYASSPLAELGWKSGWKYAQRILRKLGQQSGK